MSGHLETRIKPQFYLDSVALMRMSKTLAGTEGVLDAAMMMATPANVEILANAGLLDAAALDVGPGDLVISVRGVTSDVALAVANEADRLLEQPQGAVKGEQWQPRSIRSALEILPNANLALISVPGAFAVSEARKAIRRGLHAMIFSDNVSLRDEIELKQEALSLGRLVMGPDCGTAIINGVPLAFANQVPRGDIGIVGASGTGVQEVSCLLAAMGQGISHALGVGGRDLSAGVGGISTLMAIDALDADASTRHIVLISKPPAAEVAASILQRVASSEKSFTVCFIGGDVPALSANAGWADTLTAAAEHAASSTLTDDDQASPGIAGWAKGHLVRGLYCGGSLCAEAQVLLRNAGLIASSNAAIPGVARILDDDKHTLIDLGADEYTQDKPHPMIEPAVRDNALYEAMTDARTRVVVLDVVIGFGAHSNPAGHLIDNLPAHPRPPLVASVTGTEADPQVRSRQMQLLSDAGIKVVNSNARAVEQAVSLLPADA